MTKTSPGARANSLHWQRHVLATSRNPKQRARARAAIERLETEEAQEARTWGTQAWAETRGDDLGESPDW